MYRSFIHQFLHTFIPKLEPLFKRRSYPCRLSSHRATSLRWPVHHATSPHPTSHHPSASLVTSRHASHHVTPFFTGNGYITTQTLKEILHELDPRLTEEELVGIIEEIDEDGSGTVDFDGEPRDRSVWRFGQGVTHVCGVTL